MVLGTKAEKNGGSAPHDSPLPANCEHGTFWSVHPHGVVAQ
jgi:hypothetical protein